MHTYSGVTCQKAVSYSIRRAICRSTIYFFDFWSRPWKCDPTASSPWVSHRFHISEAYFLFRNWRLSFLERSKQQQLSMLI